MAKRPSQDSADRANQSTGHPPNKYDATWTEALQALDRTASGARASGVAAIAARLGPDDDQCPVCLTRFKPNDLRALASGSHLKGGKTAQALASELAEAEALRKIKKPRKLCEALMRPWIATLRPSQI